MENKPERKLFPADARLCVSQNKPSKRLAVTLIRSQRLEAFPPSLILETRFQPGMTTFAHKEMNQRVKFLTNHVLEFGGCNQ